MKCYKMKMKTKTKIDWKQIGWIAFVCFFILLYWYLTRSISNKWIFKSKMKEGFTWSKETVQDFETFQKTVNPNTQFDLQMLQEQASEEDVHSLLDKGTWTWTPETEFLFMDAVSRNPIIKIDPAASMEFNKKVYNENAAQQLLSWNTKEGQFLLNGSLIKNDKNEDVGTIQCTKDGLLEKKVHTGDNLWNGYKEYETSIIPNESIPQEVNGFQFVGEPCNPCVALDRDYSCPFQISLENDTGVSSIWKKLWSI